MWQRVPPTERRGRVHTSVITVAVLGDSSKEFVFDKSNVQRIYTKGSGNGGQHRNTTESVVVLTHTPTGVSVKCEDERSQHKNEAKAWAELERRLRVMHEHGSHEEKNRLRHGQIGNGKRGDKRRTYRQDGTVTDHITGKKARLKDVMKGNLAILHVK